MRTATCVIMVEFADALGDVWDASCVLTVSLSTIFYMVVKLLITTMYHLATLAVSSILYVVTYLANALKVSLIWIGQSLITTIYYVVTLAGSSILFAVTCLPQVGNTLKVPLIWIASALFEGICLLSQLLIHMVMFIPQVLGIMLRMISSVLGITLVTIIMGAIIICALYTKKPVHHLPAVWLSWMRRFVQKNTPTHQLNRTDSCPSEFACVVCLSKQKQVLLLPCRHLCLCKECSTRITNKCPLCQKRIENQLTVFA